MGISRALIPIALAVLAACSYAPKQSVRAEPEFIKAAILPGDEVEVVTVDGRKLEFTVTDVEHDALVGDSVRVEFAEISELAERSWQEPAHPCGGGQEVGCSIPGVVTAMSSYHAEYGEQFRGACVVHDFCYRHGHATYGESRELCDQGFYDAMREQCGDTGLFDLLDVESAKDRAQCLFAAEQMYAAVRRYGSKAFQTTGSTYCEYNGPPI